MNDGLVTLRPLRKEDSSLFYKWITDKELMLFNSPYKPVSEMEHDEWFSSMLNKRDDIVLFVIEESNTKNVVGSCQLMNVNALHRNAELQIRIGEKDSISKGIGSSAVKQLIDFGFNHLNLNRIYLHVFASNERAIKSYLKCGFSMEGKMRESVFINGEYLDVIIMGILKKDNG